MYIYFIFHLQTIYVFEFCYFIRKWSKRVINKKIQTYFLFGFTECKYAAYLLDQQRQVTNGKNVCGAIFCYGVIYKEHTLK